MFSILLLNWHYWADTSASSLKSKVIFVCRLCYKFFLPDVSLVKTNSTQGETDRKTWIKFDLKWDLLSLLLQHCTEFAQKPRFWQMQNSKSHIQLENSSPTLANILCLRNFLNGFLMLSFEFAKLCQWISKCEILLRYLKLCKKRISWISPSLQAELARSHLLAKILLRRLKRKLANFRHSHFLDLLILNHQLPVCSGAVVCKT